MSTATTPVPWDTDVAVDVIAALAVPGEQERAFSLLWGVDPETGRPLSEAAELDILLPYLTWCRRDVLPSVDGVGLWLRTFPDLLAAPLRDQEKLYEHL